MDLAAIQGALKQAGLDGWLFYDFHHRDPMAYSILGLDHGEMTTRRWFYWVPASGEPVKLAHRVEPRKLDALPGRQEHYLAWAELHEKLRQILVGKPKIAMQYSPMANVPYVSVVDAGTIELIRSTGAEVVTSADLVQQFEAVLDDAAYRSHCEAGEIVQRIKDDAYAMMDDRLRRSRPVTEHEVAEFILSSFEKAGLESDGDTPIVGFNEHPADPHFQPTPENTYTLHHGDTILVDLWARRATPPGIYYDITWCGFAGQEPPGPYVGLFDIVREARDTAIEFVRGRLTAGRTCHGYEVDDVARKIVSDAGYGESFLHRTGHNIGTEVHGNGVNIDNLETRDDRVIVPGVCFSIEPGIYLAGRMAVRSEVDVFVKDDGDVVVYGPMQQELLLVG
ncbi:MAG: M24 family metallopeptidase [Planctomycetota bacterium]|jgi:Xaa-Pro aminopeptidase